MQIQGYFKTRYINRSRSFPVAAHFAYVRPAPFIRFQTVRPFLKLDWLTRLRGPKLSSSTLSRLHVRTLVERNLVVWDSFIFNIIQTP